jgi:hypothetical protein
MQADILYTLNNRKPSLYLHSYIWVYLLIAVCKCNQILEIYI